MPANQDGDRHAMAPMLFGMRTVMLGRQGSGKGTQSLQLAKLLVVPHISVGDVLRDAVRSESPAGRRAGTSEEVFTRLLAGLWPRIPADRIAQLAGVSEPVPTEPAASPADEDLNALAVEVVIEVPRGSRNKYEFDHERHVLQLDRRLFSPTVYPRRLRLRP
jgi:Adenylate kinase/Inorganic pyrophosphatase